MKFKYIPMLFLAASLGLASCDDYLDKEPESNVTPAAFFTSEADLAAYTINMYGVLTSNNQGSYGMGTFAYDNDTDNQAATGYSSRWVPGNWKVGSTGGAWDFSNIRNVNYFLDQVLPKFEAKSITSQTIVRHSRFYLLCIQYASHHGKETNQKILSHNHDQFYKLQKVELNFFSINEIGGQILRNKQVLHLSLFRLTCLHKDSSERSLSNSISFHSYIFPITLLSAIKTSPKALTNKCLPYGRGLC